MALNYLSLVDNIEDQEEDATKENVSPAPATPPAKKAKVDVRPSVEIHQLRKQRKSEKITWVNNDGMQQIVFQNQSIIPRVLDIAPGEAVLFRQDLPHAGCGYEASNIRIHAAFDFIGINLYF
jgi:hypothetical protein